MWEEKYNFLLMGKTGHGKSATGNMLMNRRCFKTSANTTSETKDVECSFAKFKNTILKVVDGPGLEDTQLSTVRDKETAVKNMDKALAMCNGSVDAFLFIFKFGTRFTAEEQTALSSLKRIFGEDYMKFLIVVVTCGDQFSLAMKEEPMVITFEEWCKKQTGEFRQLYEDCSGRFVLFDNITEDERKRESQIQQLVDLARGLKSCHGTYTSESFQKAKYEREKLIAELKAPGLKEEIQQKVSLLTADIDVYSKQPTEVHKQQLLKRIQDLKKEIEVQDKGYNVLIDLRRNVRQVEDNLGNIVELQRLALELENARKMRKVWADLGVVCTFIGCVLIVVSGGICAAVLGFAAGGVASAAGGVAAGGVASAVGGVAAGGVASAAGGVAAGGVASAVGGLAAGGVATAAGGAGAGAIATAAGGVGAGTIATAVGGVAAGAIATALGSSKLK